jgi:hypothetical protein
MKNFFLLAIVLVTFTDFSFAQTNDLIIKSGDKGLYLIHTVAAKEGLFPIGRMYNVHPRHIAAFNGIDFNKGLAIGQKINIPLSDTNFSQKVFEGVPVFYQATEKESLANISIKYKPAIKNLRLWNQLTKDNISAGIKLIVGFLITNEMQDRVVKISQKTPDLEPSVSNVAKMEAQKKQPEPDIKNDESVKTEPVISKEVEKKVPVVEKKMEEKIDDKDKKLASPKSELNTIVMDNVIKSDVSGQGYFKPFFDQQIKISPISKNQTVTSGIFKTASGWQDAKYYMLIDGVQPGTILKIINPANNKTVYAKVLGQMSGIRLNAGFDIRISNSAATALEINEADKFIVKLSY